jgi:succinate dehydrogenase / fumarate reductase cytochrome b subunit
MIPLKKALTSSIGKKYIMGVTGLSLVGFMVTHLLANLTLYWPDPNLFNQYPAKLHAWGPLLKVAELALGGLFAAHAGMGLLLSEENRRMGGKYAAERTSKGGNSRFGPASINMIITGGVLLVFLVAHIIHFRFGPGIEAGVGLDAAEMTAGSGKRI